MEEGGWRQTTRRAKVNEKMKEKANRRRRGSDGGRGNESEGERRMGGETGILRGGDRNNCRVEGRAGEWRRESERDNTKEEENEWRDGGSSLEISMTINCCLTAALIKVSLQRLSAAPHRCCICAASSRRLVCLLHPRTDRECLWGGVSHSEPCSWMFGGVRGFRLFSVCLRRKVTPGATRISLQAAHCSMGGLCVCVCVCVCVFLEQEQVDATQSNISVLQVSWLVTLSACGLRRHDAFRLSAQSRSPVCWHPANTYCSYTEQK